MPRGVPKDGKTRANKVDDYRAYLPSPEEIQEKTKEIRNGWTEEDELLRRTIAPDDLEKYAEIGSLSKVRKPYPKNRKGSKSCNVATDN